MNKNAAQLELQMQMEAAAREFLETHCQQAAAVNRLGRLRDASVYHLHRAICREAGISAYVCHAQERVARANAVLRESARVGNVAPEMSTSTRALMRLAGPV